MTLRENLNLWPASEQLLLYWPGERIPSSNIVNRQNRIYYNSCIINKETEIQGSRIMCLMSQCSTAGKRNKFSFFFSPKL